MFDFSIDKIIVLAVVAVIILGPQRLPGYAAKIAQLIKYLRDIADGAKDRLRDEMGPDFDDVDWKKLDPRQYDPRRIIRNALLDDDDAPVVRVTPMPARVPSESSPTTDAKAPAVFDSEST